jgi:chromosome segregation ATPase
MKRSNIHRSRRIHSRKRSVAAKLHSMKVMKKSIGKLKRSKRLSKKQKRSFAKLARKYNTRLSFIDKVKQKVQDYKERSNRPESAKLEEQLKQAKLREAYQSIDQTYNKDIKNAEETLSKLSKEYSNKEVELKKLENELSSIERLIPAKQKQMELMNEDIEKMKRQVSVVNIKIKEIKDKELPDITTQSASARTILEGLRAEKEKAQKEVKDKINL